MWWWWWRRSWKLVDSGEVIVVIKLIVVFHTYGWYSWKCVGTFPHFANTLRLLTGNRHCTPIIGGQPGALTKLGSRGMTGATYHCGSERSV